MKIAFLVDIYGMQISKSLIEIFSSFLPISHNNVISLKLHYRGK